MRAALGTRLELMLACVTALSLPKTKAECK